MEILVQETIDSLLVKHETLRKNLSKQDIIDIKIFALNQLVPCYTTCDKGYVFTKAKMMDPQNKINIVSIVALGVEEILEKKQDKYDLWEFSNLEKIKK